MIRLAVIADDAEFEAFGREPTSTFTEASLKNSLSSKFSCHRAKKHCDLTFRTKYDILTENRVVLMENDTRISQETSCPRITI